MIMPPPVRKAVLSVHLTVSVGWIGTVLAYLALGVTAVTSRQVQTVRAAWTAMEVIGWTVIVPLAVASLITGLVMSIGTRWGLFKHYWVLFSFVLTLFSTVILIVHMFDISTLADIARQADAAELATLGGDLGHPGIGLVVLLVVQVLNIYKPKGMTRHGQRMLGRQRLAQREQPMNTLPGVEDAHR